MANKGRHINEHGSDYCTRRDCDLPYWAKGLCRLHYEQERRRSMGMEPRIHTDTCCVINCVDPTYAKGRCERHYRRAYRRKAAAK